MTVHLDTLAIAGKLKAAGFSEAQAKALSSILPNARELSPWATKNDFDILGNDLEALRRDIVDQLTLCELRLVARIAAGKVDMLKWILLVAIGFQTLVTIAALTAFARSFQP
jgi:hypothetical protein